MQLNQSRIARKQRLKLRFSRSLIVACVTVSLYLVSATGMASDAVTYIDVRSWAEYQLDHIDGDARIPISDVAKEVPLRIPDRRTPIRLYCARGGRAEQAKALLIQAGYLDVENLGGIDDARRVRGLAAQ
ncbi:hypothetical protein GCM10008090_05740 [Arenicella chitinivorans]|uniref:Rhodanese domain-containing protein n=1 Tax=Arenicella chitinivorans TaxID=1329800 RepID=A0A918VHT2_9GAMM|nr:rhodanese-like domain-containing protein [Arenicella chitinivorans]GGZ99936.1 hypothetical protein GCM10008090_05740 [Arenicella chitinivorans]